jgi:hypothetical protein
VGLLPVNSALFGKHFLLLAVRRKREYFREQFPPLNFPQHLLHKSKVIAET